MQSSSPVEFYQSRIKELALTLQQLKTRHSILGWLRLVAIVLLIVTTWYLWPQGLPMVFAGVIFSLAIFLYLVSLALQAEEKIKNTESLLTINKNELLVLNGQFTDREDGAIFLQEFKLPDNDLDLFGKASLFQYINRSPSHHGSYALASSFVYTPERSDILEKQEAVKELAGNPTWHQQLLAYGMNENITKDTEAVITTWMAEDNAFDKPVWHALRYLIPAVSFTALILNLTGNISDGALNTILLLVLGFVFSFYKKITKEYSHISKIVPQLQSAVSALQWIETASFESPLLLEKQKHLVAGKKASSEIATLRKILKRFDFRLNPLVYLPLSAFLFGDLQQILALEKWKKLQTGHITKWLETIGDMEMLSSLATLYFNHPQWIFPGIAEDWFILECRQAGHPLIKEAKLVTNDLTMNGTPQLALITGSNMAGKSTFLRTIGTNMILAMTGAPVRAAYMKVPVVKLICSMRIADNLEEETSTFYAELKKMKAIVDAVNAGEKVFILIDEMLRGTNTIDRHTGSVALIKQLIRHKAVGIIASHDIGLAELEQQYPGQIKNYHFDSSIIDEKIIFDYRLKDGVCESTNASLLMKNIGIEMEEG